MRPAPELIDVFEDVVAAMNGEETDDYTSFLLKFKPLQDGESKPVLHH